jgi:hypothetical protein
LQKPTTASHNPIDTHLWVMPAIPAAKFGKDTIFIMSMPIETSAITEGMILAEAILNKQGQVLLPSGSALKDRHILMLKTWGITGVIIQGENNDSESGKEAEYSEEILALAQAHVEQRWTWKPRNPIEKELHRLAIRRAAELVSRGK